VKLRSGAAIPEGYYGNAFAFPVAVATAGDLAARPLGFAVELVKSGEAPSTYSPCWSSQSTSPSTGSDSAPASSRILPKCR